MQADPIRAPARAQDLTLRQRVADYRVGDLERFYARLGIEEDFFINYGFMPAELRALMHPRARQAQQILDFVTQQGRVHPRDVQQQLALGTETNYWGGASNTTTRLLDQLHYRGQLRVAAREAGIRLYAPATPPTSPSKRAADDESSLDALIDFAVRKYAPLPAASLTQLIARLRYGAPQWRGSLRKAVQRTKQRLAQAHVDGTDWYWPADETALRRGS